MSPHFRTISYIPADFVLRTMELRQSDSCDILQLHYKAKRCLVLRNFEDALQICYEVLDLQKIDHRSAPSTNSVR